MQLSNTSITELEGVAQADVDFDIYIFKICRVNISSELLERVV